MRPTDAECDAALAIHAIDAFGPYRLPRETPTHRGQPQLGDHSVANPTLLQTPPMLISSPRRARAVKVCRPRRQARVL
jgi:hypothetical protein